MLRRGDGPGFTHVVGPSALALPDRPGNRGADSLHDILANPHAALLCPIPGGKEVLRVDGRARVLTGAPFFDAMADGGRRPRPAVLLETDGIFPHRPRSLRRSGLGDPASRPEG